MIKILHFSPHNEDCGIAKYQENYFSAMANMDDIKNEFFSFSPYQTRDMDVSQFSQVIDKLRKDLSHYDILHIQHEFGFFRGKQLLKIVKAAKELDKKVVVTYHTSPDLIIIKKPLTGLGPRSIVSFLRSYRHNKLLADDHIKPLLSLDLVLVHNSYTKNQLEKFDVSASKIRILPHPTYEITRPPKTHFIAKKLDRKPGDVILSQVGYLHRFKGADKSIKALCYLPNNYKLAILGGVKSDSDDQKIYDKLADLIVKLGLEKRVYISGVVVNDEDLNSYIRETDICLYPYDSVYYKGIGSGSLNLAIANERPVVAYPVSTFIETNEKFGQIMFTDSDSYYELAREIQRLDITNQTKKVVAYARANSFSNAAKELMKIYKRL